jgi:TRAP transporter 4TM/12TM fusion protein
LLGLGVGGYILVNYKSLIFRAGLPTQIDIYMGILAIILVLEITRRVVGPELPIVAIIFILYARFGPYFPSPLDHRGFTWNRLIEHTYLTTEGIFGTPIMVSSTFVFLFILYGAFLEKTGVGQFFIDMAFAATGGMRGGPAKAAVLASGLMGSISGSSVANTVTTGAFTIPAMKRVGYRPEFAGAVEAAASTGGQIMPPVMGAAAFIMAEMTGIPYFQIIAAAAIPAVLYYLAVGTMVHVEATKTGLRGLPRAQLPNARGHHEKGLASDHTPGGDHLLSHVGTVAIQGGLLQHLAGHCRGGPQEGNPHLNQGLL